MTHLTITIGQFSDQGRKPLNQDFHGAMIPQASLLETKGVAVALADGISSSEVSQVASQLAVKGFLDDYYSTAESWSVKTSAQRVLQASNSWLYAQNRNGQFRYDLNKGYVCTFSALVLKSTTAYLFHIGDARIFRVQGNALEQLTEDHRLQVSQEKSYLSRALGIKQHLEIDYLSLPLEQDDTFVLATDGVYEHVRADFITHCIREQADDLDAAAKAIAAEAYAQGSTDNLTIQIVRVDSLPEPGAAELQQSLTTLPFPPELNARMELDGYSIVRNLHSSSRSHVWLAMDKSSREQVVLKTPSVDMRGNPAYLENFLMEEWIARRINSPHVLKAPPLTRKRNYLYTVTELVEGQTLTQWMIDNPRPDLETVRNIVEQIAKGLRAFHRQEMLHQDLRPANIMIDSTGTVKIIDFGSVQVAGISEIATATGQNAVPGTLQYTAPEYLLGEYGTTRSDLFSLGVIAYQMLTGKLPYGLEIAKCRSKSELNRLVYRPAEDDKRNVPAWMDDALQKAVQINPAKRYDTLSEFLHDLRQPNQAFLGKTRAPLLERNPVRFWQGVSLMLALIIIVLLAR
ncbi:bifunctional protein-serine/threonine kinase/phosphatase [Thiothrix nivea]|nr:bifunctional protein-serine/threonine kinase/phosphatase [Thiothrix nivea]